VETIIRIGAVCVLGAVMALYLARYLPESGMLIALTVCAVAGAALLTPLGEILTFVQTMAAWSGMEESVFHPLLKTVGIAVLSRLGAELCRDAGQNALAALAELGGAVGALLVSLPLLQAVWELLEGLV